MLLKKILSKYYRSKEEMQGGVDRGEEAYILLTRETGGAIMARKPDITDVEIISGSTTPQNAAERAASTDYVVEKVVTGSNPIPSSPPDWAKDLPKPK